MRSKAYMFLIPLLLAGMYAAAVEIESPMPEIKASDIILTQGKQVRKNQGIEAEGSFLLSQWLEKSNRDEGMDDVTLRLSSFALHRKDIKESFLKNCTREELIRVSESARKKLDFESVCMMTDEFRKKYPSDPEYALMSVRGALSHMAINMKTEKALSILDEVAHDCSTSEHARAAEIYAEAIRGPESIAGIEAAHQIATMQSQEADNPYSALFSRWKILQAAEKGFFKEYINCEDIPAKDRAALVYAILENAHFAAEYERVPDLAGQVFTLVGYNHRISPKTAFSIPLSFHMRGMHDEAIEGFEAFLQAYPDSPDCDKASLYLGRSYWLKHDNINALIQYAITFEKYPDTPEAEEARSYYGSLLRKIKDEDILSSLETEKKKRLAFFANSRNPEQVWKKCALPSVTIKEMADVPVKKAEDQRFRRLAQVLEK